MSKINYKAVNHQTEYNYSFCQDQSLSNKENTCLNGNFLFKKIDDLQKIIKRQYNLQIKSNHIIKEQSNMIEKIQRSIQKIQKKTKRGNQSNAPQRSISSISKNQSSISENMDQYFNSRALSRTNKRDDSIKSKTYKTNTVKSISTSKNRSSSRKNNSTDSQTEGNNVKLLTTIVQRKLNIQKQLKQRLQSHMMQKNKKKTLKAAVNYTTYATEK